MIAEADMEIFSRILNSHGPHSIQNGSDRHSVSYKPSSGPGSGLKLVDQVYKLNSTHESWTHESSQTHELARFVSHTRQAHTYSFVEIWMPSLFITA